MSKIKDVMKSVKTGIKKGETQLGHTFVIQQPVERMLCFEAQSTAALIQNCFSQKAVEEMLRKHMGHSVPREKKIPRACIEQAKVLNTAGRICVPPSGIKKAMLSAGVAARLKKTELRLQIFIDAQSVPITYTEMVPRMDIVRIAGRTPDVRFRPQFNNWKMRFMVRFSEKLTPQSIVDLLMRAGKVGLGEWRPEKDGAYGTWELTRSIEDPKEIAEVQAECAVPLNPLVIPEWAMDIEFDSEAMRKVMAAQSDPESDEAMPDPTEIETSTVKNGDETNV